ncbi:MAG: transposase [Actinomycetota bacterium]
MDAVTKSSLLELIDEAVQQGWTHRRACEVLEVKETRAWRWRERRAGAGLEDLPAGGHPVHGLLDEEQAEIVALFEQWGETDRSHRKLAHRGSYLGRIWVSASSVKRVLAAQGLCLAAPKRTGRSERRPFPEWATYTKCSIWIFDATHFQRCRDASATAIMDLVTRKWLATIVSGEETSTQIQVVFTEALESEGLWDLIGARADGLVDLNAEDPLRPILLAVSDNGPQMRSGSTREFMAMCAIAQHFGRPGTPTDQAWIESLFSHVKTEWPHLDHIADPAELRAELEIIRKEYNTVRLHAGIGYVTPDDEHEGRGPAIRKARQEGLEQARQRRIEYHRDHRQSPGSPNVD